MKHSAVPKNRIQIFCDAEMGKLLYNPYMEWDNSHQNFTPERMDETMPRHIHLIATGGTIAGTGQAGKTSGYEAGSLPVRSLLDTLPPLPEDLQLTAEQLCSIDSNEVDSALWLRLARHINHLAQTDIDGFVITHSTDTMDETSYFLNLTVKTEKPVILTGAMRPSTAASADGPLNLYQAIHLAANPEAAGKGGSWSVSVTAFIPAGMCKR